MVVTRAQSLRKAQDDLNIVEREQQCRVKPSSSVPLVGSEFDDELYLSTRDKTKKPEACRLSTLPEISTAGTYTPTECVYR